jgi:phosphohistidine phosphatase
MPRLLLFRHAKSSWADDATADIDRPLSARGRRAAAAMAKAIAERDLIPDRVLCSPARRTRETLAALLPHLGSDGQVSIEPRLYETGASDYRAVIAESGGAAKRLMVIGHNPAIQAAALELIGEGDDKLLAELAAKFPTGALAVIDLPAAAWTGIAPRSGRLEAFLKPRDLIGGGDD